MTATTEAMYYEAARVSEPMYYEAAPVSEPVYYEAGPVSEPMYYEAADATTGDGWQSLFRDPADIVAALGRAG